MSYEEHASPVSWVEDGPTIANGGLERDPDQIVFVTAYGISRHYGGPEEGGWWYDWWEPVESVPVAYSNAEVMKAQMEIKHDGVNSNPTDRFSVLGNGEDLAVVIEDEINEFRTTERPHYS
jgi:hypothetical protein